MFMAVALVLALLVAIFALQNATVVTVHFLFWRFDVSLVLVILGAAASGAVVVGIVSTLKQIRSAIKLQEAAVINRRLERELTEARHRAATRVEQPTEPDPDPAPETGDQ